MGNLLDSLRFKADKYFQFVARYVNLFCEQLYCFPQKGHSLEIKEDANLALKIMSASGKVKINQAKITPYHAHDPTPKYCTTTYFFINNNPPQRF